MANNRAFFECGKCKEKIYFAKYYPDTGWYIDLMPELFIEEISRFLGDHSYCVDGDKSFPLSIITENDQDFTWSGLVSKDDKISINKGDDK